MPSATPIFTKRDPTTGAVLFDFSGHVHASGLDLDVSENNPDQTRSVQWIRTASQANPGTLAGFETTTRGTTQFAGVEGNALTSRAFTPDGSAATAAQVQIGTATRNLASGIATELATFAAIHDPTVASGKKSTRVLVDKDDGSGRVAAVLLDSALRSSFVQTTSLRQLAISAGQNQMFFNGVNSATAAVTHGLGRTPISAVCIGVGFNFLGSIQAWDATSVTYGFQIVNPPGGTFGPGNMSFNWIAIG
jgi:hypothetical protein